MLASLVIPREENQRFAIARNNPSTFLVINISRLGVLRVGRDFISRSLPILEFLPIFGAPPILGAAA